jgi:hypothetical protein
MRAINKNQQLGYDMPYILNRSGLKLTVEKSVASKYDADASIKYVQIKQITELHQCIFVDSMYLLAANLLPK